MLTRGSLITMLTAMGLLMLVMPAMVRAVPTTEGDSSAFTYKYEMDVDPTTQDLDGDSNADWPAHIGSISFDGGIASLSSFTRFNGIDTSIWQSSGLNAAAEWTLELHVKMGTPDQDGDGSWGFSTSSSDNAIDYLVEVEESHVQLPQDIGASSGPIIPTDSNSADFVTFRMAQDADGLWVWRNAMLLNPSDPGPPADISAAITDRLLIGAYSNRIPGPSHMDYIRMTLGAVAPVGSASVVGDYNDDGAVNAADYVVWRLNLNTSNMLPNDDTPESVSTEDYTVWKTNFGKSAGGGTSVGQAAAVPEPASWLLVTIGLMIGGCSNHRRAAMRIIRWNRLLASLKSPL